MRAGGLTSTITRITGGRGQASPVSEQNSGGEGDWRGPTSLGTSLDHEAGVDDPVEEGVERDVSGTDRFANLAGLPHVSGSRVDGSDPMGIEVAGLDEHVR